MMRSMLARSALVLMLLTAFSQAIFSDEPRQSAEIKVNDKIDIEQTREHWNRAVRSADANVWDELAALLAPNQRDSWRKETMAKRMAKDREGAGSTTAWVKYCFPGPADEENSLVLSYQQPDGKTLSRIYLERPRDYHGRRGMRRRLLATVVGDDQGARTIDLLLPDQNRFGMGEPIAGIRLEARAVQEKIRSWKNLKILLRFVNTSASETIPISASPSFFIEHGFTIVLVDAQPVDGAATFKDWYRQAERQFTMPVGLIDWHQRNHEPERLSPGETYELTVSLAVLCRGANNVTDEPYGTFRLFVTYDPNLEWNPYEGATAAWRHRVASSEFVVTVER